MWKDQHKSLPPVQRQLAMYTLPVVSQYYVIFANKKQNICHEAIGHNKKNKAQW